MNVYTSAMKQIFHELKDETFYSMRLSQVEKNISSFTYNENIIMYYRTNEKHSLYVLYNIKSIYLSLITLDLYISW